MAPRKLTLEEAIHDSPKTQSVLSIYEEDAQMLRQFAYEFHGYCEKIQAAQQALAAASHGLAALMKKYGSMKFPLEKKNSCLVTTFPMLADYIEEIGTMHQEVARQISQSMINPISRFITADLEELMQLQNLYGLVSDEHEQSTQRYAKLSTRCSEQARREAIDEVYHMRKKLHRTALHYFSSMNLVQQRRQLAFLEPLAGHLQAHLRLFRLANEFADKRDLDTLSGNARGLLLCLQREFDLERAGTAASVARLESAYPDAVFLPDDFETVQAGSPAAGQPVRLRSRRVRGYLMHRCRPGDVGGVGPARWERLHCALRSGGRLQIEARRRPSRPIAIHLRGDGGPDCAASAAPAELDDRRNVFIVTVPDVGPLILQAENARQRSEWIAAIAEAANAAEGGEDVDSDEDDNEARVRDASKEDETDEEDEAANDDPPLWLDEASEQRSSMALALGANDFAEADSVGSCVAGAAFSRQFPARLVGRCRTKPDAVVDSVLAAAASSSSTSEQQQQQQVLLTVSELGVWLVEPGSRLIRCRLPLSRARIWPASRRLFGLTAAAAGCRRVDCLALRLAPEQSGADCAFTTESVLAAVSAAARSAELAHERETALLLSNIGRLPDASPPTPAAGEDSATDKMNNKSESRDSVSEDDGEFVESLA
ncbi:hypothetical protein BOX15_Mlig021277g3 [Macrostomum lignano]|uniref:PH domain-containing protein n=1 Tax=Macrostomum lignano TaxID=282301 RepID=A0A267DJ65_9PLAT|nr:hypothetical protein BOX15_Mlig021277g3 [Macrostomum lignano]